MIGVGSRVRFTQSVERYPHALVPAGETGVVTVIEPDLIAVRMDREFPGLAGWDNEVCFERDTETLDEFGEKVEAEA
jgi:hypothetical protein